MTNLPQVLVCLGALALSAVACSAPAGAPADRGQPGAPTPSAARRAGPADEHFLYRGPEAERATALERVRRALRKDAQDPRHHAGTDRVTDLEAYLLDHRIRVTPEGSTLRVEITPAVSPVTWLWSFHVTEHDTMTKGMTETIAPPP